MKTSRVDRVSARRYLVRNAFLNWDKDASGKLDYDEFRADSASFDRETPSPRYAGNAMWQLNLAMSEDEAVQIVDLYDTTGKGEMRYDQLVKDVCAGVRRRPNRLEIAPETIQRLL